MVMIQCPECANSISSQANSCPNCGFSIFKVALKKKVRYWGIIVLMAIVSLYVFALLTDAVSW